MTCSDAETDSKPIIIKILKYLNMYRLCAKEHQGIFLNLLPIVHLRKLSSLQRYDKKIIYVNF